jgi:hypothetical protein
MLIAPPNELELPDAAEPPVSPLAFPPNPLSPLESKSMSVLPPQAASPIDVLANTNTALNDFTSAILAWRRQMAANCGKFPKLRQEFADCAFP